MKTPSIEAGSLRAHLAGVGDLEGRVLWDADRHARLSDLVQGSYLGGQLEALRGRSVLLATKHQLASALALIELDGVARRLVICPYDVSLAQLPNIVRDAEVEVVISDRILGETGDWGAATVIEPARAPVPLAGEVAAGLETEWVLLTSGTTGAPKLVAHTLRGLTGAFRGSAQAPADLIWATFYDIRRFGGLQIFLRAVLGASSLVLSNAEEAAGDHLRRLTRHGVTHISGTPTHWRRCITNPAARQFQPRYVRLSGEIADQAVLDSLKAFWPQARVGHAYASTEAGVGFEVVDGREGFPASLLDQANGDVKMRIVDGSLRIKSTRTAGRYLGNGAARLVDEEGFVDTGDIIATSQDRCYFVGRRDGTINVGGAKLHPEEVEAVINRHPHVRMSLVKAQRSRITSAIVVADVMLAAEPAAVGQTSHSQLEQEILELCRQNLARYKVPALVRFVPSLPVTQSGKLARAHA